MNYCTYFDKNYLSRGLALYSSLLKTHKTKFHLYIVAFDKFTYDFLKTKKFKSITCIYYEDFEDKELKKVKKKRSKVEYLWTCTPSIIIFLIQKYNLSSCTYLDADIYFFSCPSKIYNDQKPWSVYITPHNYHPKYDQSIQSGKYCVQYLIFKNNKTGIKVLNWWRKKCIQWCYNRVEDNKFGDQKYLDEWPEKFSDIKVSNSLGEGAAPWNIKRFKIKMNKKKIYIIENKNLYRLFFFHFHDLKFFLNNKLVFLSSYEISNDVINKIYKPYIKKIITIEKKYNINFSSKANKLGSNYFSKLFFYIKLSVKILINHKNFKIL